MQQDGVLPRFAQKDQSRQRSCRQGRLDEDRRSAFHDRSDLLLPVPILLPVSVILSSLETPDGPVGIVDSHDCLELRRSPRA